MKFIGTKIITAEPMSRAAYNEFRGWQLPADENGDDEGYLVEYMDGGKPNVPGRAGYVSWSPKEQFDNAYRRCDALTFGLALEAIKRGERVARAGWNGKGMNVYLEDQLSYTIGGGVFKGQRREYAPVLVLFNAKGIHQPGWVPSQADLLADDWEILE